MSNGGPPNAVGGNKQPPDEGNLERRVTALELRLDAVLPTLATKADLAELRGELSAQFERLRSEVREQNAQLRSEFHVSQEQLRTEMERLSNRLLRWMIATTLSLIITFTALFVGVGNLLIARLAPPSHPIASVSVDEQNRLQPANSRSKWND